MQIIQFCYRWEKMRQEVSERKERDEIERRMMVEEASKKKFETV